MRIIEGIVIIVLLLAGIASATYGLGEIVKAAFTPTELTK